MILQFLVAQQQQIRVHYIFTDIAAGNFILSMYSYWANMLSACFYEIKDMNESKLKSLHWDRRVHKSTWSNDDHAEAYATSIYVYLSQVEPPANTKPSRN